MPTQPEDNGGSSGAYMPLYLWLARPNELKTADDLDDGHVLSNEENARLRAFRFERDRRQYLTTRLLVRNALSHAPPERYRPGPLKEDDVVEYHQLALRLCRDWRGQLGKK